jgi:hypothetical protein
MTYVDDIEPRLTPYRPARPQTTAEALVEWCRDLEEELVARLERMSDEDLRWSPHPDANNAGVTVWHVARWIDFLGTRAFTGSPAADDLWHREGWKDRTGYEPDGIGFLGVGALTGYTPEEMRAVPALSAVDLAAYLGQSIAALVDRIGELGEAVLEPGPLGYSPYQLISGTLQGSFGHVGEIDALVALRARLTQDA